MNTYQYILVCVIWSILFHVRGDFMLEEYYQFKRSYPEFVLMIKAGNFYEILDKDAVIMNQVLGYKLTRLGDNVKCGFPISSLEKVIGTLEVKQLNYAVIENRKIVKEKTFENNIYHTFLFDMNHIKHHLWKIDYSLLLG